MRKIRTLRWLDASLAALLLASFFLPWLSFLGTPLAAHEIRERLRGPHRFVSFFTDTSQVSHDYTLSLFLWAVPAAAALVLATCLFRKDRAWSGLLAGIAGLAAFLCLHSELRSYPFQRLEEGAWIAFASGLGLIVVSVIRMGLALRRA